MWPCSKKIPSSNLLVSRTLVCEVRMWLPSVHRGLWTTMNLKGCRDRYHRVIQVMASFMHPFIRSSIPHSFLPNTNSKGENPVEAWGTSSTANNKGSNQ